MIETLTCKCCGEEKPLNQFPFMKYKQVYRKKCKECINVYQRDFLEKYDANKMDKQVRQFRTLWLNANNVDTKRRIRNDWYKTDFSSITLDRYWEMVVSGWQ
jgi:hypothetical protein